MTSRREFMTLLGGAAAAWPLAARAEPSSRIRRIGMLETTSVQLNAANLDGLREGLRALGYEEGKTFTIEYRSAEGREDRFRELAVELIGSRVDLIVARGTPAILAARNATASIPIVMTAVADPLLMVASLARPGGNVTGLTTLASDLHPKRLELLKEIVPALARVALMVDLSNPQGRRQWEELEAAARQLGLEALLLDPRMPADIAPALAMARARGVGGIIVNAAGLMRSNRQLIVDLAAEHRLPAIYATREFVEAGGLIAYGPSYPDLYRRAASYVDKIFKGTKPADLPVEQPTKFELIVSLKSAKALGLRVPATLLARADEVIE
jgi:putative ABC transport system substrate-binding protein